MAPWEEFVANARYTYCKNEVPKPYWSPWVNSKSDWHRPSGPTAELMKAETGTEILKPESRENSISDTFGVQGIRRVEFS